MDCDQTHSGQLRKYRCSFFVTRTFWSLAIAASLLNVVIGCRSIDCGWKSYRFAKTRADLTQPSAVQSPIQSDSAQVAPSSADAESSDVGNVSESLIQPSQLQLASYHGQSESAEDRQKCNERSERFTIFAEDAPENVDMHPEIHPDVELDHHPSNRPSVIFISDKAVQAEVPPTAPTPSPSDESTTNRASADKTEPNKFFDLSKDFPGGNAGPLTLPRMDSSASVAERRSVVEKLFADLPTPINNPLPYESEGRLITLTELQDLALANNPLLQQSVARVEAARGTMIQVGLYPNPTLGYQGDTIGTADTNGYNGGFVSQQFVTAGKLGLAQSSAMMEMRASEYDLRTTRIRVATDVRRLYFSILVEQEKIRLYQSIQRLSEEVYEAQRTLVAGGESAVYEPLQLRVLAAIASNNVLTAKNSLAAYWRQIAAALGVPDLPPCEASGSIDMQVPQIELQQAIDRMLMCNSDLTAARLRISSRQYSLRLQQVTPIPDVTVYSALQRDSTSSLTPNRTTFNMQVSVPVPVFNRNQGNVTNARANLIDADRNFAVVSNQLQTDLADAYNRYVTGQAIVSNYRDVILPDQVRVYRATYSRFRIAGQEVDFAQIIVTQQTLAQALVNYLDAVTSQWQATVDVARLLQVDDLFTMDLVPPARD